MICAECGKPMTEDLRHVDSKMDSRHEARHQISIEEFWQDNDIPNRTVSFGPFRKDKTPP